MLIELFINIFNEICLILHGGLAQICNRISLSPWVSGEIFKFNILFETTENWGLIPNSI